MKTRVATIVTLLTLLVLGFLLIQSCSIFAEDQNAADRDMLYVVCQTAGTALEGETSEGLVAVFDAVYERDAELIGAYYQADGTIIHALTRQNVALTDTDIQYADPEGTQIYSREISKGNEANCAIYQFKDGAFLLFCKAQATGLDVMLGNHMIICFAAIAVILLVYMVVTLRTLSREEKMIRRVMLALDNFSDGRFDSRIEPLQGKKQEVQEYNAIIARIQDRVFKQASRNHALNVVMNQMQNGIIAVDHELNVILVTPVAKKLLGIVGNPEGRFVSETSKDVKLEDVFNEAMRQGGVYTNEVAARTTVGRGHRPLRLYVSPMRNEGQIVGALAIVEDITEIRRLEQVRTDFAANVSHELKTPLTSIRGFVETLQAGAIDNPPMAHKFLKIIMSETERLTRLINDILSISKLESGDDEVTTERLNLNKMTRDVVDILEIHAEEKQVTVNCNMSNEPVCIIGNNDRVKQLLINLIENAIKYNKPGGSVTVQVFSNGQEANVTISDTGIGIPEESLPRVFERFYRVDKGRSRQMGGTGLGLAIVKHIVRSMGGEIEVHSKYGEGTEFLVTLPLASPMEPEKETIFDDEE